ncbi:hypothetical protein M5689_009205 [Euphorbia peplus]|nr:hypothetical protein M5689_009205 [Euphorbia peplus]
MAALDFTESSLIIRFLEAPPKHSKFTDAVFRFSVDGHTACNTTACSVSCQLDGHTLRSCPADHSIKFKNLTVNHKHSFLLNVTADNGERNASFYSWFIDTVPPTAKILSEQNYTNAGKVSVDVIFSESCPGNGGFKCINSSNCDVLLDGPSYVQASSLRVIKPYIHYRLNIIVPLTSIYGRAVVRMAEGFCADKAGNSFKRTNDSIIVIHFDRRPVFVDLWMPVSSYVLEIGGSPRTVLATNKMEDLSIYLDFSIPIINSTQELLSVLHVNSGNILPIPSANHGNRRFVFQLKNLAETEIISVELEAGFVIGRTGTPVSPPAPLTILFDSVNPEVGLSTSSAKVTKASDINVVVEFTKPVFGFEASMVKVEGGKLTRFRGLSRALYSFTVLAVTPNVVFISIPAGKVNDISGNQNFASNQLAVKHYSTPAISMALHSFVTAGVLATSVAAASLSIATSNLGAVGTLASGNTNYAASNPYMNLHGLYGHLQVFVLSDWLSVNHPIEYSETTGGLRWLIPRGKLPWKKHNTSTWHNHFYMAEELSYSSLPYRPPLVTEIDSNFGWLRQHNLSMKSGPYGLPLSSREYFTYFLRGEPLSANNVVKRMVNYKGWEDLKMNLFWLGVGGGSLLLIHALILLFLRWRMGAKTHGILLVPRFEILLLILILPCISQSSAFVIKGGTTWGIITGAFLLVIPAAFIVAVCLFLVVAIFRSSFAQYKEIRHVDIAEAWHKKLLFCFVGRPSNGKWFFREGLPSFFLPGFGILFEDRKGPTLFVYVDQTGPNAKSKWTGSGQSGIGRMRALSSDESNEEIRIPLSRRILGCARSSYIVLDLVRRVSLGVLSGIRFSESSRESLVALIITLVQFIFLVALKPYIRRAVHVVESISLLCEVGLFGLSIATGNADPIKATTCGYAMLALLFITFIAQVTNEWYALTKCILRLSRPKPNSFRLGLKFAAKGLVLPFLPRKHWSREPKTGLSAIPPLSPETEFQATDIRSVEPYSAMTATVTPVSFPGSPGVDARKAGDGKRLKGVKNEQKSEMKKLREMARASFSGMSRKEQGFLSYNPEAQPSTSDLKLQL